MPQRHVKAPTEQNDQELKDAVDLLVEEEGLSEEEAEEIKQEAEKLDRDWSMALKDLGLTLENKFRDYASRRNMKEQEWISAILQFHGPRTRKAEKGKMPSVSEVLSSKPHVNITRYRTELAISRMRDIQFPLGGDFNFHLDTAHLPDLELQVSSQEPVDESVAQFMQQQQGGMQGQMPPGQEGQQGQPPQTMGDVATSQLQEEKDKAYRMELTIGEQLVAASYGKKARDAMRDWALLGTGILKGPTIQEVPVKNYEHFEDSEGGMQSELNVEFERIPGLERVDPRFWYPDPDALEVEDICDSYELHPLSRKQIIELSKNPAFMEDSIRTLLELDPDGGHTEHSLDLLTLLDSDVNLKNRYMVKEYRGPIDKDVLLLMGEITQEEKEDSLKEFYGEVWVCQGIVIRVSLSHIDGDTSLPYAIAVWSKDDASLFGHGMPFMMKDQQRVVAATWQMVLDNAGLSAGPQIVLNKDMIDPANGKWQIEPLKIWYHTEYGGDVRQAFQFVDVPNNQQQLQSVIETAMQFADMESASPMIQAHTEPQAQVPAANMGVVLTEANVHQRELSQIWDDYVTLPIINRFVDYNMQYSSDPAIKGNFEVKVGGATERIDNQILAQDIERILATASQNPNYMLQIDESAAFRRWVAATRAGPELLRSSDEVEREIQRQQEEAANAPPDPDTIRAQAVLMQEETRKMQQQLDAQFKEREIALKEQETQAEMQLKQMELQMRQMEIQAKLEEKSLELQVTVAKLAQQQELSVAQLMKDLEISESNNQLKREIKAADMEKFEREAAMKYETGTGI